MMTLISPRQSSNFRHNRRAVVSLYLLGALFILSMIAEVIANDKPVIASYNGKLLFPVLKDYPETELGGEFATPANFRDPYIQNTIKEKGWMIWPLIPYSYDTINYDLEQPAPSSPTRRNWLGTDDQGRDVLARTIYGFRTSMLFAFMLTSVTLVAGIMLGALQGFKGGIFDMLMQRFTEIWDGLPVLYLLIIVASMVKPGFWMLLILLSLFSWMGVAGLVRAEALRVRKFDYVRAARALGVSNSTIMFRHILPNAIVSTLTYAPFIFCGAISTLTALDFLGFGLPPGSPSLGELIAQGKNNLHASWLGLTGFFVLAATLALAMFIGEGVRDALDPRKS